MLIHRTKFDIRQYFLTVITRTSVNIWSYKDCYIKFSSQEFSLDNLHESVHLTNNSIQRFYTNGDRNHSLPAHNMWILREFKSYLQSMNMGHIWGDKIYPQIKKNLLAVVLASLEDTNLETNTFELNGADFLVGFDFDPILLEINANPDLTYTTKTTREICPRVMEDLLKGMELIQTRLCNLHNNFLVIVDYANDRYACTGDFELIHECPIARFCPPQMIQLNVDGKKLTPPQKPRKFFCIKNFSDLIVQGEKLFKPIKSRYQSRNPKVPMQTKLVKTENLMLKQNSKSEKKSLQIRPRKIYRSPRKIQRNIFQTIVVKPACTDEITSYVRKLPTVLQSNNRKFVNLNDLMRYLKINENFSV